MKNIFKSLAIFIAWIFIAWLVFNPTIAYQIQSNLAKWFAAITATDIKAENKLVWLDIDWKLPVDIIPASALTTNNLYSDFWVDNWIVRSINSLWKVAFSFEYSNYIVEKQLTWTYELSYCYNETCVAVNDTFYTHCFPYSNYWVCENINN